MRALLTFAALLIALPLWALEPGEQLDDPVLEARAREISLGLRCPVCQNESIDDSHAGVAGDLRRLVRERLVAGDSNDEVVDYIVARYGEFVRLAPDRRGANWLLWGAGPLLLGLGLLLVWRALRRAPESDGLSEAERAELDKILKG